MKLKMIRAKLESDETLDLVKSNEISIKIHETVIALKGKYESKTMEILRKIPNMTRLVLWVMLSNICKG